MASTNKTTNYELSQFVGTDKPAWLADYNLDMSKIDAGMKANADGVTAAAGAAATANAGVGTLASLTTDVKTDLVSAVNEVDSNADTAQGTANSAMSTATANATAITNLNNYLNLSNFTTPIINYSNFITTGTSTNVGCAANNTGSLGKVYGQIRGVSTGSSFTISFATPLRPSEAITINGLVTHFYNDENAGGTNVWVPVPKSIVIATDGTATITDNDSLANRQHRFFLDAVLIFAKSFGDAYITE